MSLQVPGLQLSWRSDFCAYISGREGTQAGPVPHPGGCAAAHCAGLYAAIAKAFVNETEPELKAAGIVRLSLFGSVARGDASSESDVDLMAEFDASKQFSLLDMVGLENRLADIIGVRVDLVPARALKDRIRERATREAVLAF